MKKFMFDVNDFDKKVVEEPPPSFSEAQLAAARDQGFDAGKAAGLIEAETRQEEAIAAATDKIAQAAEALLAAEARRETQNAVDLLRLTLQAIRKTMPQLAQKHALVEIEGLIHETLDMRRDEPRLAVMVAAEHLDALRARLDAMATARGYNGKMIVIADDALAGTDCRVEWADGGVERVYQRLQAQIEAEFDKTVTGIESQAQID